MQHDPLTADGQEAIAGYTPVRLAARGNGWTADRQRAFLCALAETGSVSVACKAAGITARSAYRLRADPRGAAFAAAWQRALYIATNALVALAFERATKGSYREYWKNGELVAEIRQPSDAMLKFLLVRLMPSMFNCQPRDNWTSAWRAQQDFPELLGKLADCDVRADHLSSVDFEPQPRETAHEPLIPPGDENDSWQEDIDDGAARWGPPVERQSDDDALDDDDPGDDDLDDDNPGDDDLEDADAGDGAVGSRARARTHRDRDPCDSSPPAGALTPRDRTPRPGRSAGHSPSPGRSRAP